MAEEKVLKNEILKDEELDGVAGGTRYEYNELVSAVSRDKTMALTIAGLQSLGYSNLGAKDMIEDFLKDKIGIEADISVGVYLEQDYWTAVTATKICATAAKAFRTPTSSQESKRILVDKII